MHRPLPPVVFVLSLLTSDATAGLFCSAPAGCTYPYPSQVDSGPVGTRPPSMDPERFETTCLPAGHAGCAVVLSALERTTARIFTRKGATSWDESSRIAALSVTLQAPLFR